MGVKNKNPGGKQQLKESYFNEVETNLARTGEERKYWMGWTVDEEKTIMEVSTRFFLILPEDRNIAQPCRDQLNLSKIGWVSDSRVGPPSFSSSLTLTAKDSKSWTKCISTSKVSTTRSIS